MDAARDLLFSQGIEKISISKIAKEAELGVGTIYFYYKNKEDIFTALQEEGIGILYDEIKKIAANSVGQDQKLRHIALAYFDFTETQKEYFNVINYFLSASKVFFQKDLKLRIDLSASRILEIIQEIIISGQQDGLFADEDAEKFSIMFWGTLHGLLQFKKLEHTALKNQNYKEIYDYSVTKLIQAIVLK
ncbi:MAG: TetR/AcrR family transcriptional regulator [Desulfobacter sp.]|nr:MAG: TetR/AcrR family transcriptional regulator [Desulfobacter sp.]